MATGNLETAIYCKRLIDTHRSFFHDVPWKNILVASNNPTPISQEDPPTNVGWKNRPTPSMKCFVGWLPVVMQDICPSQELNATKMKKSQSEMPNRSKSQESYGLNQHLPH